MAPHGRSGSGRATGAVNRENAPSAQPTRQVASDSPATAQRGLSEEEKEEEGAFLEILSLFTDYVIPGKNG